MYRENYINSLRTELLEMVERYLSPVAMRYEYSEVPLEANIKWRPQVLVLGNYSSGKSTMINDLLGGEIQATGQAPTDDSFTVITYGDAAADSVKKGQLTFFKKPGHYRHPGHARQHHRAGPGIQLPGGDR